VTTARKKSRCRPICAPASGGQQPSATAGPIRFTASGELHPGIVEAYWRCGFYVFEGVLKPEELSDIERDLHDILDRLPVEKGRAGRRQGPAGAGADCQGPNLLWARPAQRPVRAAPRRQRPPSGEDVRAQAAEGLPREVVYPDPGLAAILRGGPAVYGHPGLLAVAAAINGPDFAPFNEAIWIKEPGKGASVAWHQDGTTHWDSPDWDQGIHGFNFMASSMAAPPPTACGSCRARTSRARSTSPRPQPTPAPSVCPRPCR
jgi:hypothetical protein